MRLDRERNGQKSSSTALLLSEGGKSASLRPVRSLSEHPRVVRLADMPQHESMHLYRPSKCRMRKKSQIRSCVLQGRQQLNVRPLRRPLHLGCCLIGMIPQKLRNTLRAAMKLTKTGETTTVRFDSDERRSSDFVTWDDQRTAWVAPEQRARQLSDSSSCSMTFTQP